jgi:hypothetical protein
MPVGAEGTVPVPPPVLLFSGEVFSPYSLLSLLLGELACAFTSYTALLCSATFYGEISFLCKEKGPKTFC